MKVSVWTTAFAISLGSVSYSFKNFNSVYKIRQLHLPLVQEEVSSKGQHKSPMEIQVSTTYVPSQKRYPEWSILRNVVVSAFCAFSLTSTTPDTSSQPITLPNHFINYGHFCGPGSPDAFGDISPVDDLDRVCQRHDQKYKLCLTDYELPRITSQAMAVRGLFPENLANIFPEDFQSCIHNADSYFVRSLSELKRVHALPKWWDRPGTAPVGSEGTKGFTKAMDYALLLLKPCFMK